MKNLKRVLLAGSVIWPLPVQAEDADVAMTQRSEIVVTAARQTSGAATKTDTPAIEAPQAISIVTDDLYLAQGAISVADTLRYLAGVQANSYGPDSRVDGAFVRGIDVLQFRDGMRDLFSYYASIRSDPYNFSQVELVRGPASVLFGSGSIGGLVNMVSKMPEFEASGELAIRYGSFDRKEMLGDVTGALAEGLAGRLVVRMRDADTQTDHVSDDRVMIAPSITWRPGGDTSITLIGLYQEDDGGSTAQFLPLVGTLYDNPNGQLDHDQFIGKPGWDRYDGRLLQGTAIVDHRLGDQVSLSLKARYIDSNLTYFTHYPNNYSNPTNPFLDEDQRIIGLYADGSYARMNVFSTDNNLRFDFRTGDNIRHVVLAGIDYSWNRVRKTGGFGYEVIDLYDIDYDAISDWGGGLPDMYPLSHEDTRQRQVGIYVQDQIRLWDRASVVVGARRDHVRTHAQGSAVEKARATTFRAGVIAELVKGVSPFVSYTESFDPISGTTSDGSPFKPKQGRQYEAGIKFHPDDMTLVTVAGYHIRESNRPIDDPDNPLGQIQAGSLTSKGFEIEASRRLPGSFEVIAAYSYNKAEIDGAGHQLDNVPKHNASVWATRNVALPADLDLRLGAGIRYSAANYSYGAAYPNGVKTPSYTLVDALAELTWRQWQLSINATNLFNKKYYAACLARGDCFNGADRNVFATVAYRF
ncbi:TonB-dependent siderophore receptor [Parapedomonas caeni]